MDTQEDVKMEPVYNFGTTPAYTYSTGSNGAVKPKQAGKSTTMLMPTGRAPIISNKHPVMHLNELTEDCKYELVSEDQEVDPKHKRKRLYTMMLTANNEKFQGVGHSKKVAKEEAAKYALLKLFSFLYIPEASMGSFVPEGTTLGKRPSVDDVQIPGIPGSKKKKKKEVAEGPRNPVMRLNEIRSGLDYVVESTTGPVHAPVFVMSLIVDDMKYEGCGNSKKKAKIDVALKALNAIEPAAAEQTVQCEPSTTT